MPRLLLLLVWPRFVCARQRLRTTTVSLATRNPIFNQGVDASHIARWLGTRQRLGRAAHAAGGCHLRQGLGKLKSEAATRSEIAAMDTRIRCVLAVVEAFVTMMLVGMVLWQ